MGSRGQEGPREEDKAKQTGRNCTYPVNKDHLTCFYCNADNILNKRTEFETTLLIQKPDIICVTEYAPKHTMLKVQDSELHVDGYDLCTNVN